MRTGRALRRLPRCGGQGIHQRREESSASSSSGARLLDAWIGGTTTNHNVPPPSTTVHPPKHTYQKQQQPLFLTGSSYLLPTLRLAPKETPASLQARLDDALHSPPPTFLWHRGNSDWHVPVVLDCSSLAPDGSPHYTPPPCGSLQQFVSSLDNFHIKVVGLVNLPSSLQADALELQLPSFRSGRSTTQSVSLRALLADLAVRTSPHQGEAVNQEIDSTTDDTLREAPPISQETNERDDDDSTRTLQTSDDQVVLSEINEKLEQLLSMKPTAAAEGTAATCTTSKEEEPPPPTGLRYSEFVVLRGRTSSVAQLLSDWFRFELDRGYAWDQREAQDYHLELPTNLTKRYRRSYQMVEAVLYFCSRHPAARPSSPASFHEWHAQLQGLVQEALQRIQMECHVTKVDATFLTSPQMRDKLQDRSLPPGTPSDSVFR